MIIIISISYFIVIVGFLISSELEDGIILQHRLSRQSPEKKGNRKSDNHSVFVGPFRGVYHHHQMREKENKDKVTADLETFNHGKRVNNRNATAKHPTLFYFLPSQRK